MLTVTYNDTTGLFFYTAYKMLALTQVLAQPPLETNAAFQTTSEVGIFLVGTSDLKAF